MRIVILGGGTAGWMAANLFAHRWAGRASVHVVESEEIGIVGVGEGSTPQLRAFFAMLGVDEAEWMPRCNATFKNGIAFRGWSERPGYKQYFHPIEQFNITPSAHRSHVQLCPSCCILLITNGQKRRAKAANDVDLA